MNWDEYEQILIGLAKRAGSKSDCAWYSERLGGNMKHECLICGENIVSNTNQTLYGRYVLRKATEQHGMQHLKDHNLLPFV